MGKKIFISIVFLGVVLGWASLARAADVVLYLIPEKRTLGVGEEFSVDIKVKTGGTLINAAQATVNFPKGVLELIGADKAGSTFNFWAEEPVITNEDGSLKFIGGSSKGVSGESLQILKMRFKTIGIGSAELVVASAVVTASDGKGTNVLSIIQGTSVVVSPKVITAEPPPPPPPSPVLTPASTTVEQPAKVTEVPPPSPKPVEQPRQVVRPAVLAKNLPAKPQLRLPLYADESRWYNHVGETVIFWDVPEDVTQVAALIDKETKTDPKIIEPGLFTGKSLGILKEGVWFAHVKFKNNIGWGPVAHYKIAIDTTPPLPFEVKIDNMASDNPRPEIKYETYDSLAGIQNSTIFIDGQEPIQTDQTISLLPLQPPGKHLVRVRIFDKAGNSVEDDLEFEVLPLQTPVIEFISRSVAQEETIFASGKSISNGLIEAQVLNAARQEVFRGKAPSDNSGNWKIVIDKVLPMGKYTLTAVVQDERGASSYSTKDESFKVRPKIILSLGGIIDFGWFEIFIIVMLVILSGASLTAWWYVAKKKMRGAYRIIVGRDIEKLSALLSDDLKELEDAQKLDDSSRLAQVAVLIDKMKKTIAKMKKYIGEEVNKLK